MAPVFRGSVLDELFENCLRQVIPVANSKEILGKLDD